MTDEPEASDAAAQRDDLLGLLLYSASHDLKSPLLTVSLSGEVLAASDGIDERARVALDALQHGVRDMERMLDALMAVSRAQRRPLEAGPVPLQQLLRGQLVITEHDASRLVVAVDPRPVVEGLGALTGGAPSEIRATVDEGAVLLRLVTPAELPEIDGSALATLLGSLQSHAGAAVEALAALEVQLQRQGGALLVRGHRAELRLPLAQEATR